MELAELKRLVVANDPAFWPELAHATDAAVRLDELLFLSALRRKARERGLDDAGHAGRRVSAPLRVALLGGYSLYPLHEIVEHLLDAARCPAELFVGEYANETAEILSAESPLGAFRPEVVVVLPAAHLCRYEGALTDAREVVQRSADLAVRRLLDLCAAAHERWSCEVVLANFGLPPRHDLGAFRSRTLASEWSYKRYVDLELGLAAPAYVRICDLEFVDNRMGALAADDRRRWFESKQPGSPARIAAIAREIARLVLSLRAPQRKVLALDLDNTLWGGVVGDDGVEGIELGDTSPRGEAFKAFQRSALALKERGVLLAVCSKNDLARAQEPFERHPEMVLRLGDIASFVANWEPKSDNLRRIAAELHVGLDSIVFADDNPAEIDVVRRFAPEVATILLDGDPADFAARLEDCRWFEPAQITREDATKTEQYRSNVERDVLRRSATDMDGYLASLEMVATVRPFVPVDVPRLAQLINKSNQFNLTTRRRTEAEVLSLATSERALAFSVRLADRFGDHGLISILIADVEGADATIDTWLMSCRVLTRQVEDLVLNELAGRARARGCRRLVGVYLPSGRNEMVRDLLPRLGFSPRGASPERDEHVLDLASFEPHPTKIARRESHDDPHRSL